MLTTEQEVSLKRVAAMIRGIDVAMLTSMNSDGSLNSRPMASSEAEFDGTLWFFTNVLAEKVAEMTQYPRVNVSYVDVNEHHYVSLSGRASLVDDQEKMKEQWTPGHRRWFPQGMDDPNLKLLRIDVDRAEYWDMLSNSMTRILGQ